MNPNSSFKELTDSISAALVDTTRKTHQIAQEDLAFHRTSNPSVVPLLERQSSRLLHLARKLSKVASFGTDVTAPKFSNPDTIDEGWRGIVDVFDNLLEKADACLDEYTGVIRRLSPSQEEQIKKAAFAQGKQKPGKAFRTQDIPKPQIHFTHPPSNHDSTPFIPLLQSKPHAIVPLDESLQIVEAEDGSQQYKQPYETEINAAKTPPNVLVKADPIRPLPFDATTATFVDTLDAVVSMLEHLKRSQEIAIDLEHHDEHSYIGLVSLMQISTRDKDWVVDTLKPWRQDLQILNEVFADPNTVKVFHGAFMDMVWLQRDLGLYVVGLFDTYHASCALGYSKHGLAFLLKKFVDFDAAKQYQMADWRIRPLPEQMFNYARSDTHFLLYIYDMMRNELIDRSDFSQPGGNLVELVMQHSKKESLQKYVRPVYDEKHGFGLGGWHDMLLRTPGKFDREQFSVFRAVHQWRDQVARDEDESVTTILTKRGLYSIAQELPMDIPSMIRCFNGQPKILLKRKKELLDVIKKARTAGANGPEMKDFFMSRSTGSDNATASLPKDQVNPALDKGVGSAVAALRKPGPLPVRAKTSSFWGPTTLASTPGADKELHGGLEHLFLALPLPSLTAEVFVNSKLQSDRQEGGSLTPAARAEHQFMRAKKPKEDDVFVIKDSAGHRKRKLVDPSPTALERNSHAANGIKDEEVEEMALDKDAEAAEMENAERKREKTERRLERKRLRRERGHSGENDTIAQKDEGSEPFDYENAPSMLHAKMVPDERSRTTSKAANPYAKSLDAPKGMRKTQTEVAGKSFTFKK